MANQAWWSERLEAWAHEGFDVAEIGDALNAQPDIASELLMQYEAMVNRNRDLRRRVIDSSISNSEKGNWLSQLDRIVVTDSLIEKWERDAIVNRPWEPFAYRAENSWRDRGRYTALQNIVKRLENLDPSSIPACQPLLVLFDDVDSEEVLSNLISDIEEDERRRRKVVSEMIELLAVDGIDASSVTNMDIATALEHLTSLQERANSARIKRLRIEKEVRPFDEDLAERMLSRGEDESSQQVSAIIDNLRDRLDSLNQSIDEWRELGLIFPHNDKVRPEELLDWEASLPGVEKTVSTHLRAMERWRDFETLWPDRCENSELPGRVDLTEEFVDLVDSLDQEWRELELEGMGIISSLEDNGFAMDIWRGRVADEPRSALAWLKTEMPRFVRAEAAVGSLLSIDASIDGEDEIERRIAILREFELDDSLLEEMEDFIDTRARRGARHRAMLEKEWLDLVRRGLVEDVSTSGLSLFEFEKLIGNSGRNNRGSGVPVERLQERMREEIANWHSQGFSTEILDEMLEDDPMDLALRISSIREAVAGHEQLRRRVAALDWTRDPEMSIVVNLDLARPERLEQLKASIPQMILELANKDVQDRHFNFIAWRPTARSRPILVPVQQNNIDDAMEAMLETMELETVKQKPIPEDEVIQESDKKEIEQDDVVLDEPAEDDALLPDEPDDEQLEKQVSTPTPTLEKEVTEPVEDRTVDVASDSSSIESLLRSLGLNQNADMFADNGDLKSVIREIASHVGIEPRDMRLDRLLRLSLRLMPKGDDDDSVRMKLVSELSSMAGELSRWTRKRLEARHSGAVGDLLKDSIKLGTALERIPGPGTRIPLDADDLQLPPFDDIQSLKEHVGTLRRRVLLTSAGGVR